MKPSINSLKSVLLEKGIRPSIHRLKVLEYMQTAQNHPSIEEIHFTLTNQIPSLSKATIYNTLNTFEKTGLVRVISMDGLEKRYDIMTHNHGHFRCGHCGNIFNFNIKIDEMPVSDLVQFRIDEKNVYFSGLCPICLKLEKKE